MSSLLNATEEVNKQQLNFLRGKDQRKTQGFSSLRFLYEYFNSDLQLQSAKKVMYDSQETVDFLIRLMDSYCHCPMDEQIFSRFIQIT